MTKGVDIVHTFFSIKMNRRKLLSFLITYLASACASSQLRPVHSKVKKPKVVVVGAGIAGMSAAHQLLKSGWEVIVLEAQSRVGGRIHTDRRFGFPKELGASWIHGSQGNPLMDLVKKAKVNTYVTNDDSVKIFNNSGVDISEAQVTFGDLKYEKLIREIAAEMDDARRDQTVAQVVQLLDPEALTDPFIRYCLTAYMEFDAGASITELSAKHWENDEKFPGRDLIVPTGYDAILSSLVDGIDIRLGMDVKSINFNQKIVQVITNQGDFSGDFVIVTVPLGYLKTHQLNFHPALPAEVLNGIKVMGFGTVNKIFCLFDQCFWPKSIQYFGYHAPTLGLFNYWLNYRTFSDVNCLVAIATGSAGKLIENWTTAKIDTEIHVALKAMFGSRANPPKAILTTGWGKDPFTRGSYTFAKAGVSPDTFKSFQKPIGNRVVWAGEHTSPDYYGTVHGAYLSGLRAAKQVQRII